MKTDAQLLHELEVHQIELELQNSELSDSRAALEVALARSTELFDFAPIGYAVLRPDGKIREINHSGARLLGRERAFLVGQPLSFFLSESSSRQFDKLVDLAIDGEVKQTTEVDLPRGDETSRKLLVTASTIRWEEPFVLVAFEDVTVQRGHEQKLRLVEAELRAERRKDDFLATLSHELRNPLAAVQTSLFLLDRVAKSEPEACQAKAIMDRQVAQLTRLVDDLLDITRIARGKIELKREVNDLGDLVRRTVSDLRPLFDKTGIQLAENLDPEPFWIDADPARITQVLGNVLGNAQKFTARGGWTEVTLRRKGKHVALRISDNGIGIEPDLLETVFEPFSQAPHDQKRVPSGLGLGLSIVRALIEMHGGTAAIESDGVGRGTVVTIVLPLVAAPAARQEARDAGPRHNRRVLIIEDNSDIGAVMGLALSKMGHVVEAAPTGAAGLALAQTFLPEIIICDLGLPEMDGFAVARAVRADPALSATYLIALSGYALPDDVRRSIAAGFNRHMAKPADLNKLQALMDEAP
jgi:PAS domain S-box-containing protein